MKIIERTETLYHRYPQQTNPQPVCIEINPEAGTIAAEVNAEIGNAVPTDVWHNRILRYTLNNILTIKAINELMAQILPLAERITAGHTEKWDGNNYVGKLDDDAQEASNEIERICDDIGDNPTDLQLVWDGNFLASDVEEAASPDATEADIAASIKKIEEAAEAEGAIINIDLEEEIKTRQRYNQENK